MYDKWIIVITEGEKNYSVRYGVDLGTNSEEDKANDLNYFFAYTELYYYSTFMTHCQMIWRLEDIFLNVG